MLLLFPEGIRAAQLRIKQGKNLQTSIRLNISGSFREMPRMENVAPLVVNVTGVKIKIWGKKGLLFVLTDPPAIENPE